MSLSRLIARLVMVPVGLAFAILAASIFLSFAVLAMEPTQVGDPVLENVFTIFSGFALAGIFGSAVFYPTILGLIIAELFSLRSLWLYLICGLGIAMLATRAPGEPMDQIAIGLDIRALASGLVGGFVYWLIAGRGAGIVKRTLDNKPKSL